MAALIVKTTDGTDIRRYTARADQMTYASLHKRVSEAFQITTPFKIQYKDDEGDEITMNCDEELSEAVSLALKLEPAVLRLKLVKMAKEGASPPPPAAPQAAPRPVPHPEAFAPPFAALMANISQQLPALVQQLPEAVRHIIPNAELDIDATVAATKAAAAAAAGAAAGAAANTFPSAFTGAATAATAAADGAASAAAVAAAALKSGLEGFHPGVTCDRTGMCPIVGNRYHLNGHDYDLCEEEYAKLRDDEKALYTTIPPPRHRYRRSADAAVHYGVTCDKSGMSPIVGNRYHLPGHNYDLCQAEFDKLPPQEQAVFQRIERPCKFNGMPIPGRGHGCGMGMGRDMRNKSKFAARFVQDMSIHDGTQMAPGTKFTKIWRLKNVGDVPWPWGAILLRVGGDSIGAPDWVPIKQDKSSVAPGEEVDVAVDMTAPSDNGRFIGYYRLSGPWGRRKFGQRVWCHIQVVDPASPPQAPSETEMSSIAAPPRGEATDEDDEAGGSAFPQCEVGPNFAKNGDGPIGGGAPMESDQMETDAPAAPTTTLCSPLAPPPADTAMAVSEEGGAAAEQGPAEGSVPNEAEEQGEEEKLIATLEAMGFLDHALIKSIIAKVGLDVEAVSHELVSLSEQADQSFSDKGEEWDAMLSDLEEMGFNDRALNQKLLAENAGSIKKTVKTLVSDGSA